MEHTALVELFPHSFLQRRDPICLPSICRIEQPILSPSRSSASRKGPRRQAYDQLSGWAAQGCLEGGSSKISVRYEAVGPEIWKRFYQRSRSDRRLSDEDLAGN